MNLRLTCSRIIYQVTDGRSLSDCLMSHLPSIKDHRDRAFVQAVCYGVCRFYTRLDVVLSHLLEKPMQEKDGDVHALILVGLYQLMFMRIPDYAAVTETVNATERLKKSWSRGFVNAVLREYLRERDAMEKIIQEDEEALYAHPDWWINAVKTAWPEQWQTILENNNQHPPFALRVNQRHMTRDEYLKTLQVAGYAAHIIPETSSGIIMEEPIAAEELPGFSEGHVSVQDGAAQFAAELLDLAPQQRVLDACAAPGGKLMHMLEIVPDLSVIAVEKEASRMALLDENLARLKINAECICADVNELKSWWDGQLFDRILLDAPCSASGIIRRHPDIKLLRTPSDIPVFANEQQTLLETVWPLLKPGGLLLYATCSILPEENMRVIEKFLAANADAHEEKITMDIGVVCPVGRQSLPGVHEMDGFYYAKLRKID